MPKKYQIPLSFLLYSFIIFFTHYFIFLAMNKAWDVKLCIVHVFLMVLGLFGFVMLFRKIKRVQEFMQRFMMFIVLKLLFSIAFLVTMIFSFGKEASLTALVSFVILYLIYTAVESLLYKKQFKSIASELSTESR